MSEYSPVYRDPILLRKDTVPPSTKRKHFAKAFPQKVSNTLITFLRVKEKHHKKGRRKGTRISKIKSCVRNKNQQLQLQMCHKLF